MSTSVRILIIEDSEDDTKLLVREIRRGGYDPTYKKIDTAEAMRAALDHNTWDIIIADYNMPQFSAPDALTLLQQRGLDLPFIVVSGAVGEESAAAVMRVGAHDFIAKSNLSRLVPAVERELRDAEARRERKQAEERLLHLAAIVESSNDAIIGKTLGGIITSWNSGAEKIYGYSADEIIGCPVSILAPPELSHDVLQILERIKRKERVDRYETVRVRKDGKQIHMSLTVSPIMDKTGKITAASTIARDITEHKRIEQAMRESDKLATVGKLAAGVAHSVRNPLTSVKMRLFSLERTANLSEDQQEDLKVISEELRNINSIVQDFLDFSRPPRLKMQKVSPSDVVDMAVNLLTQRFDSHSVEVKLERQRQLPEIWADPNQLKEVVVNLLINACEAMGNGGLIVILEEEVLEEQSDQKVVIRVSDNGPGIPESIQGRLFEPFFSTKEEGTGLGLSIAARIIEEQKGSLSFKSHEAEGATFIITLPVREEAF